MSLSFGKVNDTLFDLYLEQSCILWRGTYCMCVTSVTRSTMWRGTYCMCVTSVTRNIMHRTSTEKQGRTLCVPFISRSQWMPPRTRRHVCDEANYPPLNHVSMCYRSAIWVRSPDRTCYIRCKTLALYIRDYVSLCLLDETLKPIGPFYLVSMPGEVNDPTQEVNV